MTVFVLFGLAYGVVLQRTGFCFARAAFELIILRSRDALDGVMAGFLVATLGFGVVSLLYGYTGTTGVDRLLVLPAGAGTVLGGVLFGLGMTIAGMCAAGTLLRLGEGYVTAWAALAGIIAGAALDPFRMVRSGVLMSPGGGIWLGDWLPPAAAFLLSAVGLGALWLWLVRARPGVPDVDAGESQPSKWRAFFVPTVVGGVMLGALNVAQLALASTPWTVGYPLALVPSLWSHGISESTVRTALPLMALDGSIVLGALGSAAVTGGLRLRRPRRAREIVIALCGGLLMGVGIQTAHGCNIGGCFSAIPSLSLSGWLYLPAIVLGAWIGVKVLVRTG